jgi:trehalose 6-phosphate synthase
MSFDEVAWHAYREANMQFAEAVRAQIRAGDLVWIQDYHLMLLPMMLRSLIETESGGSSETVPEIRKVTNDLDRTEARNTLQKSPRMADGKSGRGRVKIGFFLHTPFPSSEIYRFVDRFLFFFSPSLSDSVQLTFSVVWNRILPVRREILLGLLHCDLIGFHTYDYARHFLSSCTRILGLPTMPNGAHRFCFCEETSQPG